MKRKVLTLVQLRERHIVRARPVPRTLETELRETDRSGFKALLKAIDKRRYENRAEGQRLRVMLRFETELWQKGVTLVAGIDEAGMSPLAGPVAAGAVVLRPGTRLRRVDDSKKLCEREREELAPIIRANALCWAVAFVEPEEIDRINIYRAGLLAMVRAVQGLSIWPEQLLIDGRRLRDLEIPQTRIFGGDGKSLSIAAASILAKTARDERMRAFDAVYPGYGFSRNKGYGTRDHVAALLRLGATPIHRQSFVRVRALASRA
jgi:ribonuclease HII